MTAATGDDAGAGLAGRFWLRGKEEQAVPGRLFLPAGADPVLELDGELTPSLREETRRDSPDGTVAPRVLVPVADGPGSESLVVHGIIGENQEPVTLPAAFTTGRKYQLLGPGPASQRLHAFYALSGGHVDGPEAQFTPCPAAVASPRRMDSFAGL